MISIGEENNLSQWEAYYITRHELYNNLYTLQLSLARANCK